MAENTISLMLTQEGFVDIGHNTYLSRELCISIYITPIPDYIDVSYNDFRYKKIHIDDFSDVIDIVEKTKGTETVVRLYNLQEAVRKDKLEALYLRRDTDDIYERPDENESPADGGAE